MSVKRFKSDTGEVKSLIRSKGLGTSSGTILYDEAVVLEGHQGPVLSARFSRDGTKIASGGYDKSINLWHLPTQQEEELPNYGVLSGHKSAVTSLAWLWDESLISSSADSTLGIWDSESGKRIRKLQGHEGVVNQVAVSSESLIASAGDDGCLQLWDSREKNSLNTITSNYPILATTFNNRGTTIYVGGIEPTVRAYDVRALDKELWTSGGQTDTITSLALNPDDSVLLSRAMNGNIKTYSAKEFVPEGIPRANQYGYEGAPSGSEYQVIRACFSNDSISILSGSEDRSVTSWDFGSRKLANKYTGHEGTVLDVDYHPTERIVVSSSTDGTVIVREV
ncbi:WD40 repeat-like protein [Suhomyces tanzawaensis NRRL Y-17324]|uniref:WD40 repeat-like protein n=1 Tax=Suhomyces tanzawaensis NRRL Y-17324 TaxID=984487 RepID=A0A1E4SQ44_9ASCO|nr:WD40 repeat-like protein [Suhomyces tanzawaensis NRRL Y-17324]ODV81532.1 WD40 repeat-like protein [Suhomyces tanzawaensis NRRL Y-17324]